MTTVQAIEILDSWILTGQGIVAELKHNETGLPFRTKLESLRTGKLWTVKSRLLFNHTTDEQKKFPNEKETLMFLTFKSSGNLEKSRTDILDKEKHNVFQYYLDPVGHNEKPTTGDKLKIEKE